MAGDRNLADKVVLIVGGASGIGRAAARAFADRGARLVFTDITDANGPALEKELRDQGAEALFVRSDATAESQVAALVAKVVDLYGRLDAAINLVGAIPPPDSPRARVHETSEAAWDGTVELCLKSAFLCMKHQITQMLRQGGGAIVNTASLAALHVTPNGSPAYHAAKAGVIQLTRKAAVAYAAEGIRVNVVAPGLTATDTLLSRWSAEQLQTMSTEHPLGRPVTPEEVAAAFVWLCSPEASGVTGLTVPVDGGWNAR